MRLLFVLLANLLLLLRALAGLPLRLLAARNRQPYVRFRLTGNPPYREPRRRSARRLLGAYRPEPATVTSLESFRQALELLASDSRLQGILLELESLKVPASKREVLVGLLRDFRARGKRVVAWAVSVDEEGYQLMCAADEALLAPAGELDLVGYSSEALVLGEGLGRLGLRAHYVRRGDYKTAPELFTHPYVSEIQRQTLEAFLDEKYAALVEAVAQGRRRSPEEVRAWIDGGPYSAQRAVALGLVDGLCSEADLAARLGLVGEGKEGEGEPEEETEVEPFESWRARLPWPPVRWRRLRSRPRLGLVMVSGMLHHGAGRAGWGPGGGSSGAVVRALRQAARDRRVRAVLLYVDSPGGSALASELMLEEAQQLARKKPVVAYVDRVAASGGYMVALGAREIWATPHSVVGSIGVYSGKVEASELLERLGVHVTVLTRGANAGLGSRARAFTEHERASLEASVEETYQAFLEHVSRARGRTREQVHSLAEGRVYSGARALTVGLVDRVGGFDEACRRGLELAGITAERFDLALFGRPERGLSLLGLLSGAARGPCAFCLNAWRLRGLGLAEHFD